jgi:hypothetical protein
MPTITLRQGEASPTDCKLYAVVDDTPPFTPASVVIYLYAGEPTVETVGGEPGLALRVGEVTPSDIRLWSVADSRYRYATTDIILSDPATLRSGAPPVTYYGILKRWTGASWTKAELKRWTGGAWVAAALKRWAGTEWKLVDTTGV